ncbi:MAG: family 43 glycosylhydrolase [Candidatus Dormibacteria bacterium]
MPLASMKLRATRAVLRTAAAAALLPLLALATGATSAVALSNGAAPPNPTYPGDFPDPFVLPADGAYYAYATNGPGGNIQALRSSDLSAWTALPDALPALPAWASPGSTWGPAVLRRGTEYRLYYTVHDTQLNIQCISVATSAQAAGPFVDGSTAPLICQTDLGGSIDPQPFVDAAGNAFMLWKADTPYGIASLWSQPLRADGLGLTGAPVELLQADQAWESNNIEGPAMLAAGGSYQLFFSGNYWWRNSYAVGGAVCSSPLGPCTSSAAPVYTSRGGAIAPGGESFFTDFQGATRVAYHAWAGGHAGPGNPRTMRIDRVKLGATGVHLYGPTSLAGRVAVAGGDNGLWQATGTGGSDFVPGGGVLSAAPAVVTVASPDDHLTIATGSDHDLWIRSDTESWRRLNSSPTYCIDNPAAALVAGSAGPSLVVACQGADHGLWTASGPLGAGVPTLHGWTGLGGILAAGPAVTTVGGALSYIVLGSDTRIYTRTATTGYAATPWRCLGHPAAAAAAGTAYFGCDGLDHTLWWSENPGSGWTSARSLGGVLVDGPAVAAWPQGATFTVEGGDHALWETTLMDGWRSPFSSDGGVVRYGVGGST